MSPAALGYVVHGREMGRARRPQEPTARTLAKVLRAAGKPWAWLDEVYEPEPAAK